MRRQQGIPIVRETTASSEFDGKAFVEARLGAGYDLVGYTLKDPRLGDRR
jgi:hypothetical protein